MPEENPEFDRRAAIRRAFLGTGFTPKCEVVEWNGEKIEVRRISIGRQKYIDKAIKRTVVATDAKGQKVATETQDGFMMTILSVIFSCYVPGTNELVFDEKDKDELLGMSADGFMEPILEAVSKVNKPKEQTEEDEVLKNSARTSAGASST